MVAIPSVHMNGTSYDELFRQNRDAHEAVRAAWEALSKASPNGRDFYPQGDDAIKVASAEHYERMRKLTVILDDLETIAEGILNQKRD